MVQLIPITDDNYDAALAVAVTPEQQPFVADSHPVGQVILAKAAVGRWGLRWEPLAIVADEAVAGQTVGVVGLAFTPDNYEARFFHLAINAANQRQGWGRLAVLALIERSRLAGCEILSLTVNPRNAAAKDLYFACGFVTTGQQVQGEDLMTLVL